MTINATAAILLALYVAVARRRGIPEDALSGTVQNDILKEYVARGTYIYPPRAVAAPGHRRLRLLRASACRAGTPISISGYHIREAGATAPQEIAFTFANALEYVRAARAAGPRPGALRRAPLVLLRLPLRLHRGGGEVPRRAPAVGAADEGAPRRRRTRKAQHLRFHVQTGGVTLTAQQPDNNVVRVALQALAAVLGGCQSLHTNAQGRGAGAAHRGLGAPGPAHAAGDRLRVGRGGHRRPAGRLLRGGGGHRRAGGARRCALLDRIEARGGALRGHRAGRDPARDPGVGLPPPARGGVGRARDRGREPLRRRTARSRPATSCASTPTLERAQVERVRALRARRDPRRLGGGPATRWRSARAAGENLMPAMVDAVLAWATVGEIAGRLRARVRRAPGDAGPVTRGPRDARARARSFRLRRRRR